MRLALHGGLFSGKSTLAKALQDRGFVYVNYTDFLKELYARSLRAVGIDITKEQVIARKEQERTYIISFGSRIGFDQGNFVEECLDEQASSICHPADHVNDGLYPDIVFDNVRFDAQFEKLIPFGFRLVRLVTPYRVRLQRAHEKGLSTAQFDARIADKSEQPLRPFDGEVAVSVNGPMHDVLDALTAQIVFLQSLERLEKRGVSQQP